jgi:GT2 family glycosyltransferase
MPEDPFVSFIVPTYNRAEVLHACVTALLEQEYPADRFEVIVSDDGSMPPTERTLTSIQNTRDVSLRIVRHQTRGAAYTRNHGARAARGSVYIFVDDDIILPPQGITRHLKALHRFAPCCVNSPWQYKPCLAEAMQASPLGRFRLRLEEWIAARTVYRPIEPGYSEPEALSSHNLSILASDFWRIGGFDEAFPHAGCEDQEFGYRARDHGLRCVYDLSLVPWHDDRRLSLRQFGLRQTRGVIGAVLIWHKWPHRRTDVELVRENNWVRWSDGAPLIIKKLTKAALAAGGLFETLHTLVGLLERTAPDSQLLQRLYQVVTGLYLFRGFREGLRLYGPIPDRVEERHGEWAVRLHGGGQ